MCRPDVAHILVVVGVAAAAAIELRPALAAVGLGVDVSCCKISLHLLIERAVVDIAHFVLVDAYELVTREDVAVGSDSDVVVAAAAAAESLYRAWSLIEVEHKVEEVELLAGLFVVEDTLCEDLILLENSRELLLCESVFI